MMGTTTRLSGIKDRFCAFLIAVSCNPSRIKIHRVVLYLEFGEPTAGKLNKNFIVLINNKLFNEPTELAFTCHTFRPAKHLADYLIMSEQSGMSQAACSIRLFLLNPK